MYKQAFPTGYVDRPGGHVYQATGRTITVGTSSAQFLPNDPRRVAIALSPLAPAAALTRHKTVYVDAAPTDALGTLLSFTAPASHPCLIRNTGVHNVSGSPTLQLQYVDGSTVITVNPTNLTFNTPMGFILPAGDTIRWEITGAAVGGSTADAFISVEELPAPHRLSLGFSQPAVLGEGLTFLEGTGPHWITEQQHGPILFGEIRAVADVNLEVGVLIVHHVCCRKRGDESDLPYESAR